MGTPQRKRMFVVGLVAVLVMGLVVPGQAAFTKLYQFKNTTGASQSSVRATTHGWELITSQYASPSTWVPATMGFTMPSGVFCSTLTYGGPAVSPNTYVRVGWQTADASCRLRDLRWGGGQTVVPTQLSGVSGGGMVFYDYPDPGDLTVVITNDNAEGAISVFDIQFAVAGLALEWDDLVPLLDVGLVGLRVASIAEDIQTLRDDIAAHAAELPAPSVNSLEQKLARAADYMWEGLAEHLGGNPDRALFVWEKAARQVTSLIKEVTNLSDKGNLAEYLYYRWIEPGDGDMATAPEIVDALLALPDGQVLQSLEPLPCGELPAYSGLDPANCVEWGTTYELQPGQYTAFVVPNMSLGSGLIMGGSILDDNGDVLLDWLEQSVAEPTVIVNATATPGSLWPPDHKEVPIELTVTLRDDLPAVWDWYVDEVHSNQPEDGTGDGDTGPDWWIEPVDRQSLWLRSERSGEHPSEVRCYTIVLRAVDGDGNISAPYTLVVPVHHDMG